MHTDEPREVQGVELGYDPRDIDMKGIVRVAIYFFAFATVFFGGGAIWWVYIGRVTNINQPDTRKAAIVGPRVQGNVEAKIDIMAMRQQERRLMDATETYQELGPNGQPVTRQRIPVARAMELLAQRGMPDVKSDEKAVSPGNTIPQNAVGPAASSTPTSPATQNQGAVPTPDLGAGATGSTAGTVAP